MCFHFTTTFVVDCHSLNTAISVDVQLALSSHLVCVVIKSSPAVRLAEGNPGMSGTGRSAWDRWVSLVLL